MLTDTEGGVEVETQLYVCVTGSGSDFRRIKREFFEGRVIDCRGNEIFCGKLDRLFDRTG